MLCTQTESKPHGSLVAFLFAKDMKSFYFATPKETRKYRYLTQCDRVALVVDTRDKFPDDTSKIEAVTISGSAQEVGSGHAFNTLAKLYIKRHPNLEIFTDNKTMVFFRIDVEQLTYVTEFQKVYYWTPRPVDEAIF